MRISEPTTMATDYLLALVAGIFATLLLVSAWSGESISQGMWAVAFAVTALAASLGGTYHGFRTSLAPVDAERLWRAALLLTPVISFLILTATALDRQPPSLRVALITFAASKLIAFSLLARRSGSFAVTMYDSGISLLLILALGLWDMAVGGVEGSARWMTAGAGVALGGAVIQQRRWLRWKHVSHNDIFHLVQALACYLLYRGALYA